MSSVRIEIRFFFYFYTYTSNDTLSEAIVFSSRTKYTLKSVKSVIVIF